MGHYPERSDFTNEQEELLKTLQVKLSKLDYEYLKRIHVFLERIDLYLEILKPWFGRY
ncbi:MAG: hypothetical protein PF440_11715 [Thiomicrorhabdus sp.]|jgi:hypothetical protein|nr:hypothetical protein [Thiomicrorhabdus sp.]